MEAKIVRDIDGLLKLEDEWRDIERQDESGTYYSTFEYSRDWALSNQKYGRANPFVICVYEEKKLKGIAPLAIEKRKKGPFSYVMLRFLGSADFNCFLCADCARGAAIISAIFDKILKNSNSWDRIHLENVKSGSELSKWLLKSSKYNRYFNMEIEAPYADFSGVNGFEEYRQKSGCSGKKARRHSKKLFKDAGYKFRVVSAKEEDLLEQVMKMHIENQRHRRGKGSEERSSIFEIDHIRDMVERHMSGNENVLYAFLESQQGDVMAYVMCFSHKGVIHFWNTAYDPEYERYNIGRVLFYEALSHFSREDCIQRCDFGCGKYSWKFEWTYDFEVNYTLDYLREDSYAAKNLEVLRMFKRNILIQGR